MKLGLKISVIVAAAAVTTAAHAAGRWRSLAYDDIPQPAATSIASNLRRAGENVQSLSCGSTPGVSAKVDTSYGCSSGVTLCYANVDHDGGLVGAGCGACGEAGQPMCAPWDR